MVTDKPEPSRRRRIGLLGGSFDPVHAAHLELARCARDAFALDEIRFIPAARPPHKRGRRLASGPDRVHMLALAIGGWEAARVDARELGREGPSYSIDTVESILSEEAGADLYFLIGADNLEGLARWHRFEDLAAAVTFLVAQRPDQGDLDLDGLRRAFPGFRAEVLPWDGRDISSTDLRRRARSGEALHGDVPAAVADYIAERSLYEARN
ncbi:MAG: nicotinate-nucleotide adenylyltransferase [Planctomycetes bacterium]|nr:nicotinate-nucleotide adenylyltransferase [Planctomycetota bacterium]